MTKEQAEFLSKCLQHFDIEHTVRDDYSGRCMYGKITHGIVITYPSELLPAVINYLREEDAQAPAFNQKLRQDSMGYDYIIY